MHVLHHFLRDDLRPPVLVPRVGDDGKEDFLRHRGEVFEGRVAEVSEDDLRVDVVGVEFDWRELEEAQRLLLELIRRVRRLRAGVEGGAGRSANDRERLKGPVLEDRPNFVTFVDRGDEKIKNNGRSLGDGPR